MKLKRFEALTLQEALGAVKAELGSDAVIVSTRRINKGGRFLGLLSQPMIEVTAAVDRGASPKESKKTVDDQNRRVSMPVKPKAEPEFVAERHWYESSTEAEPLANPSFGEHLKVAALLDPVNQQIADLREEMKELRSGGSDPDTVIGPIRRELESFRALMGEVLADRSAHRLATLPKDMTMYHEALVAAGIHSSLAANLVRTVGETVGSGGTVSDETIAELLRDQMEQVVSTSGPLVTPGGLQKVVMLVGPTGVGKTTTIAKLASHFMQSPTRIKTVIVTLDTYRVAAVEQLRVYARILKVPVEVAVTPAELPMCIAKHPDAGLVLVDTAGRSPQDPAGARELAAIAEQKLALETHLVLSAPTDLTVQEEIVRRYSRIPVHRLLLTKLDEMPQLGRLFNLIHQTGLPLSYLSMGQRVPEDLEQATKKSILDRIDLAAAWEQVSSQHAGVEVA
ncbi:flagellar biosynthesis protein FlhF [Candidatus Nitronereus thalassa]|uniref:Flagellar biosynthesis protein FlhF n=1 Tax=Candidatus Nitronereus thalassa TaxID=3020898 RepID=A0ABU3K6C6_9BACT|nr:flagellar biosynthesis protein FlhF [Candidatus Nitronereus thalassa]MDT7041902.1 flagellar biosynthesis protein FlhF [Candidatus Nitronereus thalassa]